MSEEIEVDTKAVRLVTYAAALNSASKFNHMFRLRTAAKIQSVINAYIAQEVDRATSKAHCRKSLSWTEIAQALELPRGTAYNRYSRKKEEQ